MVPWPIHLHHKERESAQRVQPVYGSALSGAAGHCMDSCTSARQLAQHADTLSSSTVGQCLALLAAAWTAEPAAYHLNLAAP